MCFNELESNLYLLTKTNVYFSCGQIYSLLGGEYADQSSSAFAIFKFMQSASSALAFAYSSKIWLWWQLLIGRGWWGCGCRHFITVRTKKCNRIQSGRRRRVKPSVFTVAAKNSLGFGGFGVGGCCPRSKSCIYSTTLGSKSGGIILFCMLM
jgi:hypothetical protein